MSFFPGTRISQPGARREGVCTHGRRSCEEGPQVEKCEHVGTVDVGLNSDIDVCEDCVKLGDTWVQLRVCKTCGYVGCCDSSKNRHARKH